MGEMAKMGGGLTGKGEGRVTAGAMRVEGRGSSREER